MKRSKPQLLNFEIGIPFRLIQIATEHIDQSLFGFTGAVEAYNSLFETGVYHKTTDTELVPIVQSMLFNCPDETHPIFVALRERRSRYNRTL